MLDLDENLCIPYEPGLALRVRFIARDVVKLIQLFMYKTSFCWLALVFGLWLEASKDAQAHGYTDSLRVHLPTAQGDAYIDLCNELGWKYRIQRPDSSLYFIGLVRDSAQVRQTPYGLSKALSIGGLAYYYQGKYVEAFDWHTQALGVAVQSQDTLQEAHAYNNLGRIFITQGDWSRAYAYFLRARTLFEKIDDQSGLAYVYRSLSQVYEGQHEYAAALHANEEALRIRQQLQDVSGQISTLQQTADIARQMGDYDKAQRLYEQTRDLSALAEDSVRLASTFLGLAEVWLAKQDLAQAEHFAQRTHQLADQMNNPRLEASIHLLLARIALRQQRLGEGRRWLEEVSAFAEPAQDLYLQREAAFLYHEWALLRGDIALALRCYQRYVRHKDQLNDAEETKLMARAEMRLALDRKEREIADLQTQENRRCQELARERTVNGLQTATLMLSGLLIVLGWYGYRRQRQSHQAISLQHQQIETQHRQIQDQNQVLQQRNAQLSTLNQEKDHLMSVVVHDLNAPLNHIRGFSQLITYTGHLNEEQRSYLDRIEQTAQAGSRLIGDLLRVSAVGDKKPVLQPVSLHTFVEEKYRDHLPAAQAKRIDLVLELPQAPFTFETDPQYLSGILDNLLSNAIKFSEPGRRVWLRAYRSEQQWTISVRDEGPGFSKEDKDRLYRKFEKLSARPTGGESSNGLGLAIVRMLVEQLGGQISLRSEVGTGAEFEVAFPALYPLVMT